jgi:uncharacterized protein
VQGAGVPALRPLGVGLTYFPALGPFLRRRADLIDVVEVSPETLWLQDSRGRYVCDQVEFDRLTEFPAPKVVHGVSNPLGGSVPPDPVRLELVSGIAESFGSDLVSEHLSVARVASAGRCHSTGFMLPPRQTGEGVGVAAGSVRAMAAGVKAALAVENGVSYLQPRRDEMADGDFLSAVAEEADVGILLDLHNAYANERNGRDSMAKFVAALPLERIVEIHVAGGLPHGHYWLDAHSGAMPDALFSFARELVGSLPHLRVINFELMPVYFARFGADGITRELERCHELWSARGHEPRARPRRHRAVTSSAGTSPAPAVWERQLAALVRQPLPAGALSAGAPEHGPAAVPDQLPRQPRGELGDALSNDPGIDVLRFLVTEFRAGMLARVLTLATRLLLLHLGEAGVRRLYGAFCATRPPELFPAAEAEAFAAYLARLDVEIPHLRAVISFELALQRTSAEGGATTIEFQGAPEEILAALARGACPSPPTAKSQSVVVEAG